MSAPDAPLDTDRPFRRRDALAAGVTDKELRGPGYRSLAHGVYVGAHVPVTPALHARAAALPFPEGSWASHVSAALIHRVPLPWLLEQPTGRQHVTVTRARDRRSRDGVDCHLRPAGLTMLKDGTRVSQPAQLFVELAEVLDRLDLVVAGDHLVRRTSLTLSQLLAFCAATTLPGGEAARAAVTDVRERVDSPMETRLRMLIVWAGLPEPRVNFTIRDECGVPVRMYDLSYPEQRLAIDYDGRVHIDRAENWEEDTERRELSHDDGWRLITVLARGVYVTPERTLERIRRAALERGVPDVPAVLGDGWRRHFARLRA